MSRLSKVARVTCRIAALALVVILASGCGGDEGDVVDATSTKPPRPGVSSLSYSPKPYYKDMSKMQVRFTTSRRTGPGRVYSVSLFPGLDNRDERCYRSSDGLGSYKTVRGCVNKTYVVTIVTVDVEGNLELELPACFGRARLEVWSEGDYRHPLKRVRVMRKLTFQILPARR